MSVRDEASAEVRWRRPLHVQTDGSDSSDSDSSKSSCESFEDMFLLSDAALLHPLRSFIDE